MSPEKVAYWYFRLNGFFMLENFVIHPGENGGQRTDADILAIRFPNRAERFVDDPTDIMEDDTAGLRLSNSVVDIVIAEVKAGRVKLNGPWTKEERQNIDRVIAAIGCLPRKKIRRAATALYQAGLYEQGDLRIRLVAVGRVRDESTAEQYPGVIQVLWHEMLNFIWRRFRKYAQQKADVQQWDDTGRELKNLAEHHERDDFASKVIANFH
ncbi:MAG: hypothetical protein R3C46_03835 [Hyphomonadaceae bacterium]